MSSYEAGINNIKTQEEIKQNVLGRLNASLASSKNVSGSHSMPSTTLSRVTSARSQKVQGK